MNETIKKAIKELQQENLLDDKLRITPEGKREVERILSNDNDDKCRDIVFKTLWNKLRDDFFETDARNFALRLLEFERLLAKSNIDLYSELKELGHQ